MKYTGDFYSTDETLYKIEIETKKSGADSSLLLSATPFVSSISSEDKHIYSPIKCGGATIGILTTSYNEDFYTGESKGVKVKLIEVSKLVNNTRTSTNKVEWIGYITPSIYS